jgi:hypothetical protein
VELQPTVPGGTPMPNLLRAMGEAFRKVIGYGRDLTPLDQRHQDAQRLEEIVANLRRAGVNTRAVQRAAEIQERARNK